MCGSFRAEHYIDYLTTQPAIRTKCMRITGAHKGQLSGLKRLGHTIDPMGSLTAFDDKNLETIVIMGLGRIASCQLFSREMKRFLGGKIRVDVKASLLHEAIIAKQ